MREREERKKERIISNKLIIIIYYYSPTSLSPLHLYLVVPTATNVECLPNEMKRNCILLLVLFILSLFNTTNQLLVQLIYRSISSYPISLSISSSVVVLVLILIIIIVVVEENNLSVEVIIIQQHRQLLSRRPLIGGSCWK